MDKGQITQAFVDKYRVEYYMNVSARAVAGMNDLVSLNILTFRFY